MDWLSLLSALALVLIIEGLMPALYPQKYKQMIAQIAQLPLAQIRKIGAVLLGFGLLLLIFLR